MRYKQFGKTGENLSVICLGTWVLGGKNFGSVPEKDAIEAVHAMIDQGVNFIDTAPIYADGESEVVLGKALKDKRDKVFLLSKFGSFYPTGRPKEMGPVREASPKYVKIFCEESLCRLKTDYLDGFLIHWPDPGTPLEDTIGALQELKKEGKVRFIGMSNFDQGLADQVYDLGGLEIVQYPYSMVNRSREELLRRYAERGCGTMGYAALGAGILTGSIRTLPQFGKDDVRETFYDFFKEPKFSQTMQLLKTLDEIAAQRGVPLAQIALNWCVQRDYLHSAMTGVRSAAEALENCAAMDWELTEGEISRIDTAIADAGL